MKEITSVNNELVKELAKLQQKKYRNEKDLFLIEGLKGVQDAINFGLKIEHVLIDKNSKIDLSLFNDETLSIVNEPVLKKISTTQSPPEIIAVAKQKHYSLTDSLKKENSLFILLENVKDPGNMGTIIRTALAFGVDAIILSDNSIDLYNPKIVRSSVGNLWKMPIIKLDKQKIKEALSNYQEFQFLATEVSENNSPKMFNQIDYKKPTVIMFGSEAAGISKELIEISHSSITIPMNNQVESLNLSISSGVILYEAYRQRAAI